MERLRAKARLLVAAMLLSAMMVVPSGVKAQDGDVITNGSNIAGEVYIINGRPQFSFGNTGDCPGVAPPGTACWVELQFVWQCAEPWCFFDSSSGWFRVPTGQDFFRAPICADGANHWMVNSRVHYHIVDVHTFEFWAQKEWNAAISAYGWIAKSIFDVNLNAGHRISGGTKVKTVTSSDSVSPYGRIAESFGYIQGPQSC